MSAKAETKLSKAIRDALEASGFWVIRVQSGNVRVRRGRMHLAPKGTPDLYLPGYGHIEVKAPGGKLKPEQVSWHARAVELGVRVETVDSVRAAVEVAVRWRQEREYERAMGWGA